MKIQLKKMIFALTCMLLISSAHAYKYIIYTDDIKTDKAEEVSNLIKSTYPFSKFDIEVEIVKLPPNDLKCSSKYGVDRLIMCDNINKIQRRALRDGGDQAMIIKSYEKYGGSSQVGGGVPVMTTASSPRVMLHEYLHTLGLCDEYEYLAKEAAIFCGARSSRPNLVLFNPIDPYASDNTARSRHMGQISWFSEINDHTPITNSGGTRLGTGDVDFTNKVPPTTSDVPAALSEPTGLYKGKICNQAIPQKISWHPGAGATIMANIDAGLGAPLEKIVEQILISKGAKTKLQYRNETETEGPPKTQESAGSVAETPNRPERVNNTARSFFKSFFGWASDAVESVKKVLSL